MLKTEQFLADYGLTPEEATALLQTDIIQKLSELKNSVGETYSNQLDALDSQVLTFLKTEEAEQILEENKKEPIVLVVDDDFDESEFDDDFDFGDFEADIDDDFSIRVTDADKKIEKRSTPKAKKKKDVAFAKTQEDVPASVFFMGYMGTEVPEVDSDGAIVFMRDDVVIRGLYNENFLGIKAMPMDGAKMRVEAISRDGALLADALPQYLENASYTEMPADVLSLKREEVSSVFDTQQISTNGGTTNVTFDAIKNTLDSVNKGEGTLAFPIGQAVHPKMVAKSNFFIAPKKLYGLANCENFYTATCFGYRYITNFCEGNDLKQLRIFELGGAHLNVPFNNTRNKTIGNSLFGDEGTAFSSKVQNIVEGPSESLLLVGYTDFLPKGIDYEVADNLSADAGYFVFASPNSSRIFYVLAVVFNYFRKYYKISDVRATLTPVSKQYTILFGAEDMPSGFMMVKAKNAVAGSPSRLLPTNPEAYALEIVGQNALAFSEYVNIEKAREELRFTGEVVEAPAQEGVAEYDPVEVLEKFKTQLGLMKQFLDLLESPDDDEEIAVANDRISAAEFMIETLEEEVAELNMGTETTEVSEVVNEDTPDSDLELGEMILGNDQEELILPSIGEEEVKDEIEEQVAEIEKDAPSPEMLEDDDFEDDDFDFDDDDFDFAKGGRTNKTKHIRVGYVYLNQFGYELEDEVIEDSKDVEEVREKWKSEMMNDPDLISYQIVEVAMDGSERKVPSKFHGFAKGGEVEPKNSTAIPMTGSLEGVDVKKVFEEATAYADFEEYTKEERDAIGEAEGFESEAYSATTLPKNFPWQTAEIISSVEPFEFIEESMGVLIEKGYDPEKYALSLNTNFGKNPKLLTDVIAQNDEGYFEVVFVVEISDDERKILERENKFRSSYYAKGGRTMDDKVSDKIRLLREEGKPQDQAVAIALSMRDEGKLEKGGVLDNEFKFDKNFVIYVPSTSNVGDRISASEMDERVTEVENLVANEFGGFTKTETDGGYKASSGDIIEEEIVKVSVFSTDAAWDENEKRLVRAIRLWAKEWGQEAIGFEYEGDLYYIDAKGKFQLGGVTRNEMIDTMEMMEDA